MKLHDGVYTEGMFPLLNVVNGKGWWCVSAHDAFQRRAQAKNRGWDPSDRSWAHEVHGCELLIPGEFFE